MLSLVPSCLMALDKVAEDNTLISLNSDEPVEDEEASKMVGGSNQP